MPRSPDPRILVVGGGSAGARHARNLVSLGAAVALADPEPARAKSVEGAEAVDFDPSDRGGGVDPASYDGVVVASPSVHHADQATWALEGGAVVLVEKPLAVDESGLDELVDMAGDRLTVGYNLRLHAPVRRVRDLVARGRVGDVVSVHAWFGHHLAAWRPDVDYRDTYSARAAEGGGILLDASHELDLLVWMFGPQWSVEGAVMEKRSALEIDTEDTVVATLRSAAGVPASVSLDSVSPRYRRGLEVVGTDATVRLDWAAGTLTVSGASGIETEDARDPVDASYVREAEAFLALVRGEGAPVVPAAEGAATVRMCERIRRAAGW